MNFPTAERVLSNISSGTNIPPRKQNTSERIFATAFWTVSFLMKEHTIDETAIDTIMYINVFKNSSARILGSMPDSELIFTINPSRHIKTQQIKLMMQ